MPRSTLLAALLLASAAGAGEPPLFRVLVFIRAEGFVHPSIADGVGLVEALAAAEGFAVDVTDDPAVFTPAALASYRAAVWLNTTGDVLDPAHEAALEAWVEAGGGWVGVHAAADCEYDWPWYGELLGNGAWFDSHPAIQEAEVAVEDPTHPATGGWPAAFAFTEEWYNFRANPRPAAVVLMTVDEATYDPGPGAMGADHPVAWHHRQGTGRAFYTALGHRPETYLDPGFVAHLRGGILWAAGHLVFEDGFERGDTSAWTAVSGHPGRATAAALAFRADAARLARPSPAAGGVPGRPGGSIRSPER